MRSVRARTVCGLVACVGLLAAVVLMLKPVRASFGDDPLLRLQAFDRPLGSFPTEVDCGAVLTSLRSPSSAANLYTIARDGACHREGYRRLMAAIAAGVVVVVLSLSIVVASWPPPPPRPPRERKPRPERPRETEGQKAEAKAEAKEEVKAEAPAAVSPGDEAR